MDNSENLNELFTALAKAQEEITIAEKNVDNVFLKSKYADLVSIINAARPYLTKNGLCVIQQLITVEGETFLVTRMGHKSGQWIQSKVAVVVKEKSDGKTNYMQAFGSAITYLRKYCYSSLVGVAAGTAEDDDGEKAGPKGDYDKPKAVPVKAVDLIGEDELAHIESLIGNDSVLLHDALRKCNVGHLKQVKKVWYAGMVNWIENQIAEKAKSEDFIL